uniref:Uncharacterized protein n=1 Tax=Ustilaginoidea virens nonsegmented virus 1 TaxID=1520125 RepID=A0A075FBL7_9VIRU|nr:hypothetical protein [Ustilaginoidea virens nonsegmented virus 1]
MASDDDRMLLEAFNARFGQDITQVEVVKRLLGSPHVRAWYREYRAERATENSLPDEWRAAGLTAAQWAEIGPARLRIRKERAQASEDISRAAREFQDRLSEIESRASARIDPLLTPLLRVIGSGVQDLPLERQIAIETGPADARAERVKTQMAQWRAWAVAEVRAGRDPFRA